MPVARERRVVVPTGFHQRKGRRGLSRLDSDESLSASPLASSSATAHAGDTECMGADDTRALSSGSDISSRSFASVCGESAEIAFRGVSRLTSSSVDSTGFRKVGANSRGPSSPDRLESCNKAMINNALGANKDEEVKTGPFTSQLLKLSRFLGVCVVPHPSQQFEDIIASGEWRRKRARRVLIYSPVFPPYISFGGGVALTYFALARKLSQRGDTEVRVYSPRTDNMDCCSTFAYPEFLFSLPSMNNLSRLWHEICWADVVVAPEGICTTFITFMARVLHTPMLFNVHTDVRHVLRMGGQPLFVQGCVEWGTRISTWTATTSFTTSQRYRDKMNAKGFQIHGAFSPRIKTEVFCEMGGAEDSKQALMKERLWMRGIDEGGEKEEKEMEVEREREEERERERTNKGTLNQGGGKMRRRSIGRRHREGRSEREREGTRHGGIALDMMSLPPSTSSSSSSSSAMGRNLVGGELDDDVTILVCAGRLSVEKRIPLLCKALPPGCVLCVVGDGPDGDEIERLHDPANGIVIRRGMVRQSRLRKLYKAADFLVSASNFETLGMTAFEANLCGTAALVDSGSPGFRNQIQPGVNGELIDFSDVERAKESLAEAVIAKRCGERFSCAETIRRAVKADSMYAFDRELPQLDDLVDQIALIRIGRKVEWAAYFILGFFLCFVWTIYKIFIVLARISPFEFIKDNRVPWDAKPKTEFPETDLK